MALRVGRRNMSPDDDQQQQQSSLSVRYASAACVTCRRGKRRCDRKMPACDLCSKRNVECTYPTRREAHAASLSTADTVSLEDFDASAIYFIAPNIFQQARLELARVDLTVPASVALLVGDLSSVRAIGACWFVTIHRWFPIVCKSNFFSCLLNPLARRRAELSLLALSMKLCCTAPHLAAASAPPSPGDDMYDGGNHHAARTPLYRAAKRFYHEAETAGLVSVHVLQAGILIALYELAHALYPAAYLTVGACARHGLAIGIDKFSLVQWGGGGGADEPRSWDEVEERRRVWWAVLIFDRFLSFSNPQRPLSTPDPTFDTYLPVDDIAWDEGTAKPSDAVRISNGFTLQMGSFARQGQATYLLSQALRSIQSLPPAMDGDETAQLRRTLLALVHAADSEATIRRLEFCAQSALCLSTILLLQEHELLRGGAAPAGGSADDGGSARLLSSETLSSEARTALDRLSSAAESYNETCVIHPDASDSVPLFVIHVMYQVACIFLRLQALGGGTSSPGGPEASVIREKVGAIMSLLRLMDARWRLAGIYLNILEAQEFAMSTEATQRGSQCFAINGLLDPPIRAL